MKKSIYLFLLGLGLVFATSCSKNDTEPSANSSSQGDPKNPIEASVILATADITYVDDNGRKGEFKGSKASQFSNIKSEHTVADITEINDGFVMRILFYDEVRKTDLNVLIGRR